MANKTNNIKVFNPRFGIAGVELQHQLTEQGYQALHIPLFDIQPGEHIARISTLNLTNSGLIFTSRNAVEQLVIHLSTPQKQQLQQSNIIAIGAATQQALQAQGCHNISIPTQADSEHLLQMPQLQKHSAFFLFKGEAGRDYIEQGFALLNKTLDIFNVYKRVWLPLTTKQLAEISHCDAILLTSGEMLSHLIQALKSAKCPLNSNCKIIVPSTRIEKIAEQYQLPNVINSQSALNSELVKQLNRTFIG